MSEPLKKLMEAAKQDKKLEQELLALDEKLQKQSVEEIMAIAARHGIILEQADFEELSLEDLDEAAGGFTMVWRVHV